MAVLLVLVALIITVLFCDSNNEINPSIEEKFAIMCSNQTYRILILSTRSFRIKLNRTLLLQRNITTIHLLATIIDRNVLQFHDHTDVTMMKIGILNNLSGKYQ